MYLLIYFIYSDFKIGSMASIFFYSFPMKLHLLLFDMRHTVLSSMTKIFFTFLFIVLIFL